MKQTALLILIISILTVKSNAQEYSRLMEQQNTNFYDIQSSFNKFWDGKSVEKGKGWKQFKRWEYFMEPRVYPTGKITNPGLVFEEHRKFIDKYSSSKKSTNNKAANWTPMGPTNWAVQGWNPGIGRINAITVDPNNTSIIYVGTPAGGCWKSTNGGTTWSPLTDDMATLGVSGIAVDPNNSNTIYIATGDGDGNDTYSIGVMKSVDGGNSWSNTGLNWLTTQSRVMRRILIDPSNSKTLIVATSNGLYKTTDAGSNWTSILGGSIRDVEFKTDDPNTIFACSSNQFYKSTNGGTSFTTILNGTPSSNVGRLSIATTPHDANYVYLLASDAGDASFSGLYRSTDAGTSFSLRSNSPNVFGYNTNGLDAGGQSWYDMALAVSPTNKNEVYTGGINVWKSTNGGTTLNCLSKWNWPSGSYEYVHADIHTLDFYGNTLFSGSDGGIFKSINSGATFTDLTSGLQNSQFYRLSTSQVDAGILLCGAQDNGSFMLKNNIWTHVTGADGMECIVDYANPNNMYVSSQNGKLYKSTNGGGSFSVITNSIGLEGAWVSPYAQDPANPNTILLGYHDIWKTTDGGNTWNSITSFAGSNDLKSLVIAPSDNNRIYTATNSVLYKSINGGTSWTNITSGLPNNAITYLSVHNTNPNTVWVSLSGFTGGEKVYKTTDGGSTWINLSGNLPNLPINCITYEYGSANGVYIGTDIGIYYKNDNMPLWQPYMDGLPNVMVYELEIQYATNKLRAATYGRGIWESDLYVTLPPVAQFETLDTLICPGACAQFTNTSPNLGLNWTWYFPGGTPSTSTNLNPLICYSTIGSYPVSLTVTNPAGTDSTYVVNYINVQTSGNGVTLPLVEGFESSTSIPSGWAIENSDQGITWQHNPSVGGFGLSSSSFYLDNFSTNFRGEKDNIISPRLNLSNVTNAEITFDVAHAQWSFAKSDTLSVYYSNDCGVTKNLVYQKDGTSLSTASNFPILFNPTASQWRNDTININATAGLNSIQFYFENTSDNGNVIYIDNIDIHEVMPSSIIENSSRNFNIYPNPFKNTIQINSRSNHFINNISIYNSIGILVFSKTINDFQTLLNLGKLTSGFYLIKIQSDDETITTRIIK